MKKKMTMKDKMKMEAEHTTNKKQQKKIVTDHEREYGKKYYPALKKMEKGLKSKALKSKRKGK